MDAGGEQVQQANVAEPEGVTTLAVPREFVEQGQGSGIVAYKEQR